MTERNHGDAGDVFWNDLAADLEDPEILRQYIIEAVRIATIDHVVNGLEDARKAASISKADLARASGSSRQVVRRLLTADNRNPTLGTLAEVAAPLGLRVTLEPIPEEERQHTVAPLLTGTHPDFRALTEFLDQLRPGGGQVAAA